MKILDVLYEFYGEGILIKIKDEQGYKRCRLTKRTPKSVLYYFNS